MKLYKTVKVVHPKYIGKEGMIEKIFPAGELTDKVIYQVRFSDSTNSGQFSEDELVMMNSYRHFYLYAKHWYKRQDVVEDLKLLIKNRSGCDPKDLNIGDIYQNLNGLVWQAISRSGNPEHFFNEFIMDTTFPENRWKYTGEPHESHEIVILKKFLSILSLTKKSDIDGELGEPDPKILPLSEESIKRLKEMKEPWPK